MKLAVEPACLKALAHLDRVTTVDEFMLANWMIVCEKSLKARFMFSGEPDDQAGAWLRFEYVRALGRIP